jgi:hypothetical protein
LVSNALKLQDPGVNLTYVKTDQLSNGTTADILQLTFNALGVTKTNTGCMSTKKIT